MCLWCPCGTSAGASCQVRCPLQHCTGLGRRMDVVGQPAVDTAGCELSSSIPAWDKCSSAASALPHHADSAILPSVVAGVRCADNGPKQGLQGVDNGQVCWSVCGNFYQR